MTARVGIDVGGTFTDLVLLDEETGHWHLRKVPSTPEEPSRAVLAALREALEEAGGVASDVASLGHGTTVATNLLVEGRLAPTALLTTEGFRDLLEIGRQRRHDLYDLQADGPRPLVPRRLRLEIPERIRSDGAVERPLDIDEVERAVTFLLPLGIEAVAICFLHSYANASHEAMAAEAVRRMAPRLAVASSHQVLREFREVERLSTTVLNAALMPAVAGYLAGLQRATKALGLPGEPWVLQSHGGLASLRRAADFPVTLIASGPSAGVMGAAFVAGQVGLSDLITLDMGGTSTDVGLLRGGRPTFVYQREVLGYPVRGATVDVHSIGAGGGSVAWIDPGGVLKVGPASAGAVPGPASYGLGGKAPTVTDAHVVLGRLNPEVALGGRVPLHPALAEAAIGEQVARPLALPVETAAGGILEIVTANIVRAVRRLTVERGLDPRHFALVAFGGAGPLHATSVARELGMATVLVPRHPGLLSALGLLVGEGRADFSRTRLLPGDEAGWAEGREVLAGLEKEARAWAEGEGHREVCLEALVDIRYLGQNSEIPVPLGAPGDETPWAAVAGRFHEAHDRAYGAAFPDAPMELVAFRIAARARRAVSPPPPSDPGPRRPVAPSRRPVGLGPRPRRPFPEVPVYERSLLSPGERLRGPAVIDQIDSTTLVGPGEEAWVDPWGNLHLTLT